MTGIVHLVGAGPGDPGLLTVRAVELIAHADVILYDRLIPPTALGARARRRGADRRRQEGDGPQFPQEETDRLLVEHARAGRTRRAAQGRRPVRLRARRRGGARVRARRASRSRSCPAMTAGVAAPAYAGIPVTHRDLASGVAFVTGHEDPAQAGDGARLAGARRLPRDARLLHGRARRCRASPSGWSPAGAPRASRWRSCERGTMPGQRTVLGTLQRHRRARGRGGHPRAGDHARGPGGRAAASELAWLERAAAPRPQRRGHACARAGERARGPAAGARRRRRRGARDPDRAARGRAPRPRRLRPLCVTSPNGAERLLDAPARRPRRSRGSPSPRSGRARRERCARGASRPTSCPSAPSPRGSWRRCAACPCGAP